MPAQLSPALLSAVPPVRGRGRSAPEAGRLARGRSVAVLPFPEVEPGAGGRAEAAAEQQERDEGRQRRGHAGTAAAAGLWPRRGLRAAGAEGRGGAEGRAGPRSPAAGGDSGPAPRPPRCRLSVAEGAVGDEEQTPTPPAQPPVTLPAQKFGHMGCDCIWDRPSHRFLHLWPNTSALC